MLLLAFTSCQNNGYPGYPFIPPTTETKLPQLATEKVASALDIAGVIEELDDSPAPDGMNVSWVVADAVQQIFAVRSMSANTEGPSTGTPVTIIATVTFKGYSGKGLNKDSGISEIKSGSIELTFKGTVSGTDTVTANLNTFAAKTTTPLTLVQERTGYVSNNYTVSAENMSGTSEVSFTYTEPTSGSSEIVPSNINTNEVVINSGSSITVGSNTPVVDNTWKGGVDTSWYDVNSSATEFTISTPEEFAGLAKIVNDGTDDFAGDTIILAADIDLGNIEWEPIGYGRTDNKDPYSYKDDTFNCFAGIFNGDDHTISNLYMHKDSAANTWERSYVALFGCVKTGAIIKNLSIENVEIYANSFVGAFVGYIPSGSSERGSVTLEGLTVTGNLTMVGQFSIGGILGRNETGTDLAMSDCHVSVNTGSSITGHAYGQVSNFVGGISGSNYSSVSNTIDNVSVKNLSIVGDTEGVGSIMGHFNIGTISNVTVENVSLEITDPLSNGDAKSIGAITGLVGAGSGDTTKELLTISGENKFSNVVMKFPISGFTPFCNGLVGTYRIDSIEGVDPSTASVIGVTEYSGIEYIFAE